MIANVIDKLVAAISPVAAINRRKARTLLRSYDGAEPSRISSHKQVKNQPADLELLGPFGADKARACARDLVRNNAYAAGVVDTIASSVVGCGIKAQSIAETIEGDDIENLNDSRDEIWSNWCEVCDVNGEYTFDEIQIIAQREIVEAGEVLIRLIRTPERRFRGILRPVPLALELIEADRLAGDKDTYALNIAKGNGNRIVRGVEVDDLGKPVAYWIYKDHPNQPYAVSRTPVRVPAYEIRHLFRKERIGQTRGITWFAPVLAPIRDLGTYLDNELQASAVSSCFTVAIKTDSPAGNLMNPEGETNSDSAGNTITNIEPGLIMRLKSSESVEGINPGRPNSSAEPWIALIIRQIAVGTGLSYETVARDYSQTTYSSSRTSQLEDRRRFRCWQQYLIRNLLQPVWDAFCDAAAFSSIPSFPNSNQLLLNRRKVVPVEWQTPEWEWVDPQTEQAAAQSSIDNFMSTYASELGSRGKNWRSVFYQRAKEERLKKKLLLQTMQERQLDISAAQSGGGVPVEQPAEQVAASIDPMVVEQPAVDVSATALNSAQVTSMVEVIMQVGSGAMPKETAKAIITAAFPTMSQLLVNQIIDPIQPGTVGPDGAPQQPVASADQERTNGSGEMMGLSTLQFNRNRKAILKTLEDLANGSIGEVQAKVFLSGIGMNQDNVDLLIKDAMDGSVDDVPEGPIE